MVVPEFSLDVPMRMEERDAPAAGPGELLVRVRAAGVNPSDIATRAGRHIYSKTVTPPYVPGWEMAGEVLALGEGVEGFEVGQRVLGRTRSGAYAEVVRAEARVAMALPDSFRYAQGAGIAVPMYTSWNALVRKAKAGPGETVLVQGGAGGVGMTAIQLAKRLGCRVFATVSSQAKGDFCLEMGADAVINYREADFAARCLELTGGRGVDVIVEMVACDNFDKDLEAIRVGGRIVVVGTGTGKGPMTRFRVPATMTKDAHIYGITGQNLTAYFPELTRRLSALLKEGGFRIHVDREFPLEAANEAHELVLSGNFTGKVVLIP
ncbi:MAG: NADPH:quinone reductase [bacterium]|nr:NADPH:quinone reductase [bacterium]